MYFLHFTLWNNGRLLDKSHFSFHNIDGLALKIKNKNKKINNNKIYNYLGYYKKVATFYNTFFQNCQDFHRAYVNVVIFTTVLQLGMGRPPYDRGVIHRLLGVCFGILHQQNTIIVLKYGGTGVRRPKATLPPVR